MVEQSRLLARGANGWSTVKERGKRRIRRMKDEGWVFVWLGYEMLREREREREREAVAHPASPPPCLLLFKSIRKLLHSYNFPCRIDRYKTFRKSIPAQVK